MAIILITGCSSGFGLHSALALARRGETVVATVRDIAKARPIAESDVGSKIDVVTLDVTDARSRETAVAGVLARHGRIDVLVNNAGIFTFGPAETLGEASLRELFEANVFGVFAMTMAVLPGMRERRAGRIVNVSSAGAFGVRPFMTGYCASKHALDALTSGMDGELAAFNIRVMSVAPVSYVTNIVRSEPDGHSPYGDAPLRYFNDFITAMRQRTDFSPVTDAIIEAATAAEPQRRYLVAPPGNPFEAIVAAKNVLENARRAGR